MNSDLLTCSPAGTPANPSAMPDGEPENTTTDTCGPKSIESFATYDPATSSWRTSQGTFPWGSDEFLETWPRAGMTRNGIAFQQQPLAPLTGATGFSLWPTPRANEALAARITSSADPERHPNLETVILRREPTATPQLGNGHPAPRTDSAWPVRQPSVYGGTDGVPRGLDAHRARHRVIGNAVVPQVAEWIGRRLPA